MKQLMILGAFLASAATVNVEAAPLALQQTLGLDSARGACYVDTPKFDVLHSNICIAMLPGTSAVAVFGVLGLDQSTGQYKVEFLDNTCPNTQYTTQEGRTCSRRIPRFVDVTQRIKVTDLSTGQSKILSATASFEDGR